MPPEIRSLPSARLIEPKALMSIRNLELRARSVVEGFWHGLHRSPYHGFSVEFSEYRQYSPGDDPRYVDWRVFARSDRYFIKKFEDETNLRCHVLADRSRSMMYGSAGYTKADYAATLAATLAYFLHRQGDAVGLLTFDGAVRDYLPARHRAGHLRQVMHALEQPPEGRGTDLSAPLERIANLVRKRGLMVLISDFLAPIERLERGLLGLAAGGHELTVFQIHDPAELSLELGQAAVFEDIESSGTLYIDPQAARPEYLRRFREHGDAVRAMCDKLGASHHLLSTDRPLELALFDFLQTRMRRGRQVRTRGANRGGSS